VAGAVHEVLQRVDVRACPGPVPPWTAWVPDRVVPKAFPVRQCV
jgi:hypothetical protein